MRETTTNISLTPSPTGQAVTLRLADLSLWQNYWTSHQLPVELFQTLSDCCLNIPWVDAPDKHTKLNIRGKSYTIYRLCQGPAQAIRRTIYCMQYFDWVKTHGCQHWRSVAASMQPEEVHAMILAAFCSKMGYTAPEDNNPDQSLPARCAEIYLSIANALGFNQGIIHTVAQILATSLAHASQTPPPKEQKACLITKLLEMSHTIDVFERGQDENKLVEILGEDVYFFLGQYKKNKCIQNDFVELATQQAQEFAFLTGTQVIDQIFNTAQSTTPAFDEDNLYQTYFQLPKKFKQLQETMSFAMTFRTLESPAQVPTTAKIDDFEKQHFFYKVIPDMRWNIVLRGLLGELFPLRYMDQGPLAIPYKHKDHLVVLEQGAYKIIQQFHQKISILQQHEEDEQTAYQSLSYVAPLANYYPDLFNGNQLARDEKEPLVGLRFAPQDTSVHRIFLGEIQHGQRPHDLDHDISNMDLGRKIDDREWLCNLDELTQIAARRHQLGHATYNEIMARLRFDFEGQSSQICIFHDNLESRLVAQLRAQDLLFAFQLRYPEQIPAQYQVPISFYRHLHKKNKIEWYTQEAQHNDRESAKNQPRLLPYVLLTQLGHPNFNLDSVDVDVLQQTLVLLRQLSPATTAYFAPVFLTLDQDIQYAAINQDFDHWISIYSGLSGQQQKQFVSQWPLAPILNKFDKSQRHRGLPDPWLHKFGDIIYHTAPNFAKEMINDFIDTVPEAKACLSLGNDFLLFDNVSMDYYLSGEDEKRKHHLLEINTLFDKVSNNYLVALLAAEKHLHPDFTRLAVHHLMMSSSPYHQLQLLSQYPHLVESQIKDANSFKLYQQLIFDKNVRFALYEQLEAVIAKYSLIHSLNELIDLVEEVTHYQTNNQFSTEKINAFWHKLNIQALHLDQKRNTLSNAQMCRYLFLYPKLANTIIEHAIHPELFWNDETVQIEFQRAIYGLDIQHWLEIASPLSTELAAFLQFAGIAPPPTLISAQQPIKSNEQNI